MEHITENQVILYAEKLNLPSKPNPIELQKIADALESTYGHISTVWDACKIGEKIQNPKAVKERERLVRKKNEKEIAENENKSNSKYM